MAHELIDPIARRIGYPEPVISPLNDGIAWLPGVLRYTVVGEDGRVHASGRFVSDAIHE